MISPTEVLSHVELDSTLTREDAEALDNELDKLLKAVLDCYDFKEAERVLSKLGELHKVLALLAFRFNIPLSRRQREIVREYDRWDVVEVRREVYEKIRKQEFPWCGRGTVKGDSKGQKRRN